MSKEKPYNCIIIVGYDLYEEITSYFQKEQVQVKTPTTEIFFKGLPVFPVSTLNEALDIAAGMNPTIYKPHFVLSAPEFLTNPAEENNA